MVSVARVCQRRLVDVDVWCCGWCLAMERVVFS